MRKVEFRVTPKHPHCEDEWRRVEVAPGPGYPDKARMSEAGGVESVLRRFQPRFRAVESTDRSVAKVSAPD